MYTFDAMVEAILAAGRAQQEGDPETAKKHIEEARVCFDETVEEIVERREERRRWTTY